ncbi:MAG: hypothetical protein E7545_08535 [Ruminococcaceae bacterium]|nr:hypothetical protein [Oscillospiraceae bacterium]
MQPLIFPTPKKINVKDGVFRLYNVSVYVDKAFDYRVKKAAVKLRGLISEATGNFHKFAVLTEKSQEGVLIRFNPSIKAQAYKINTTDTALIIEAGEDAGAFYGIQTVIQLVSSNGMALPLVEIEDYPDLEYRGFYHDATRGRVPSVEGVKEIVDQISLTKMNSLQLYVEHPFEFLEFSNIGNTYDDILTAEDLLEIDQYCYDNFIDFIPSLSCFGHLYELLMKPEYKDLCELPDYKPTEHFFRERMNHHTINPSDPRSLELVCSLIDQYLPLFRSNYFNICCDETFDLGKGRNKGKDTVELYIGFVSKLCEHVTGLGKTVMMWGDIALKHPEMLSKIPKGTIMLNWCYDKCPDISLIEKIKECGLPQIVCPGNTGWHRFMEDPTISVPNITIMNKAAVKNNAIGMLNTNWGDCGHAAPFKATLYGTLIGAETSWNVSTEINGDYEKRACKFLYGVDENIIPMYTEVAHKTYMTAPWNIFYEWLFKRQPIWHADTQKDCMDSIVLCEDFIERLEGLSGNDRLQAIIIAVKGNIILNNCMLHIAPDCKPVADLKEYVYDWFEEYAQLWLSDSKPSELCEIIKYLEEIIR